MEQERDLVSDESEELVVVDEPVTDNRSTIEKEFLTLLTKQHEILTEGLAVKNFNLESSSQVAIKSPDKSRLRSILLKGREKLLQSIGSGIAKKVTTTKTKQGNKVEEESLVQSGVITKKHITINKARRGRNKNLQERLEVLEVKKKVWNENIKEVLAQKMAQRQDKENLNAAHARMEERERSGRGFREESFIHDRHQRVAETRNNERTGHRHQHVRDGTPVYPSARNREGSSTQSATAGNRNRFHSNREARQRGSAAIKQERHSLEEGEITDIHHHYDYGQVEGNWERNDNGAYRDPRTRNRDMQDRVMRTYVDDADRPETNEREDQGYRRRENQNRPGSSSGRREQNSQDRDGRTPSSDRENSRRHGNSFQEDRGFNRSRSQFATHTATSSRNDEYENVSGEEDNRDGARGESEQTPSHWSGSMRGARNWRGKGRPQFAPNEQRARRGTSWRGRGSHRQFHDTHDGSTSRHYQQERNQDRNYWRNSNEDRSISPSMSERRPWSGDRERGTGWKPPTVPLPFEEENWEKDTTEGTKRPETQTRSEEDQNLDGNKTAENRNQRSGLPSAISSNTKTGNMVNHGKSTLAQDTDSSDGIIVEDSWSPGDSSDEKETTKDTGEVPASPADKRTDDDTTKTDSVANAATNVPHATKKRPHSTAEKCPSKRKKDDTHSESQDNPNSRSDIMGKVNKDAKELPGSSNSLPSTPSLPLSLPKEGKPVDATPAERTPKGSNSGNDENERTDYPVLSIPEPTDAAKTSVVTISTTSVLNTASSTAVASDQVTSDKGLTSALSDTINSTVVTIIPGLDKEATLDSDPKTPVSTTASTNILQTIMSTIEASNEKITNETLIENLSARGLAENILEVVSAAFTPTVKDTTTANGVPRDSVSPVVPINLPIPTDTTPASHVPETATNIETEREEIRISIRSDIFEENSDDDCPSVAPPGNLDPPTMMSAQNLLETENEFLEFLGCSTQVSSPAVTISDFIVAMTTTQSPSIFTASTVPSQTVPVTTVTNASVANELRPPPIQNSPQVVTQPDLSNVTHTATTASTSSQSSTPGSTTDANSTNRANGAIPNEPPRNNVNLQDVMRKVMEKIMEKKVDFDAKVNYYNQLFSDPNPLTLTREELIDCVNFFRGDFFRMFEVLDASLISVSITNTAPLFDYEKETKNLDPPIEVLTDYYSVLIEAVIFSRYCHTEIIRRIVQVIVFRIMRLLHYFMVHVNPELAETKFQNVCAMLLNKESLQHLTKSPAADQFYLPKVITQLWDTVRATAGRKYFYQGAIIDYKHCQPEIFQHRIDKFKESYYRSKRNAITDGTSTSTQPSFQPTTQTDQVAQQPNATITQIARPPSGSSTQTQLQPYAYPQTQLASSSPQFQTQNIPQQRTQATATPCHTMTHPQNQSQRLPINQQTSQPIQSHQNLQRTTQAVPYIQQTVVSQTQNNSAQSQTQVQEQLTLRQRLLQQNNPQTPQVTMQNQRLVRRLSGPQQQASQVQQRQVQLSQSSTMVPNVQRQQPQPHYQNEIARTQGQFILTQPQQNPQQQQQLHQMLQRTALVHQQQLQQARQQQLQESQRQQQLRQAQLQQQQLQESQRQQQQLQESQRQQQLRQVQQLQQQQLQESQRQQQQLQLRQQQQQQLQMQQSQPAANVGAPNQHMTQSSRTSTNPDDDIQIIGYGSGSRQQVEQAHVSAPASSPPTIRVHYGGVQIAQTPFHSAATVTTNSSSPPNITLSSGSGAQPTNLVLPNNTLVQSGVPVHNPNNQAQFQNIQSDRAAIGYTGMNVEAVGGGQGMSTTVLGLVSSGEQHVNLSSVSPVTGYSNLPIAGPSTSQVMQSTPNALSLSNANQITNNPIRQLTQEEINERTNTVYLPDSNGNVSLSFQTTEEAFAHLYGRNNI